MRTIARLRPSPATVIASIALLVSLSGTSIAAVNALPPNSVGTAQLKNNAVVSAKVKNRSLLAVDFRAGQLPAGPQGAKGEQGAQGEKGDKGDTGAPGLSGREVVTVTSPSVIGIAASATAVCPAGKRAIGGGVERRGSYSFLGPWIFASRPQGEDSWFGAARLSQSGGSNWSVAVYAVCATVAS